MKLKILIAMVVVLFSISLPVNAAKTGFLEGKAYEVIIKVRDSEGKIKWYKVKSDGSREELQIKPGDRFEFLYEDSVDLDAIVIEPKKNKKD